MNSLFVLLSVIAVGLMVGNLSLRGISLGTSAILFVALVAGHFGMTPPEAFGTLGLAVFVYSVGISAGPTFFRGLASNARVMATLSVIIVVSGVVVTWICAKLFGLSAEISAGLMAGSMTSTPALGAISESVQNPTLVAVGFGVAYPFGVIAVVLSVQLAMKFLRSPKDEAAEQQQASQSKTSIERQMVEIANPGIVGKRPSEVAVSADSSCQISRVQSDGRWKPIPPGYVFQLGDRVLLVGHRSEASRVVETLGVLCEGDHAVLDADRERKKVVVTSPNIYGHSLQELRMRSRYGVTVVRVRRFDQEFVPSAQTQIDFGDTLALVGEPADLEKIEAVVGHRPRTVNETDLLSLVVGIGLGIFLGTASLQLGGLSISLGLAGGPLCVGLVLGHFRRIGPIRGSFPPAAQILLTEGGLSLFLADAGLRAGANVWSVLSELGAVLCIVAAAIAVIPLLIGYISAVYLFRLKLLEALGATCGGMTSTPGLAVLTAATDSNQPVTSYVAAYPVALVLITIVAPLLVELINQF